MLNRNIDSKSVHLHKVERQLAFSVTFVLLKLDPTPHDREELCRICETQKDVLEAVVNIRDNGLEATLKLMAARHAAVHAAAGHA